MGTFELINAIGSLVGGGILTLWAQAVKDRADRERQMLDAALQRHAATESAQTAAREFQSDRGFHFTRRAIALIVVLSAITFPILLPAFIQDITIVIGYYDTARGFWPWSSSYETINWVAVGSGVRPLVISPVTNNILITIIGMFFGNQITKR